MKRPPHWKILLILLGLSFIAFFPALSNPFLFDDLLAISQNQWLEWKNIPSFFHSFIHDSNWNFVGYRPWLMASLVVNKEFFGANPVSFRVTNLLLHWVNASLLYFFAVTIVGDSNRWAAALGAIIFLLHPVQGNVVHLVWKRSDLWAAFGIFGAILAAQYSRLLSLFLALIALTSKETAILLPLIWGLVIFFFYPKKKNKWDVALGCSMAALSGLFIYIIFVIQPEVLAQRGFVSETYVPPSLQLDSWKYLMTQGANFIEYLGILILPISLSVYHHIPPVQSVGDPRFLFSLFLFLTLVGTSVFLFRRRPIIAFGILWFFLLLSPGSSVFPLNLPFDEDRLYLPIAGVALIAGDFFRKKQPTRLSFLVVGLFCALAIAKEWSMAEVWSSPLRLWSSNVENEPDDPRPWIQLGRVLGDLGEHERAVNAFSKAHLLEPLYALPFLERGTERLLLGERDGAQGDLMAAYRLDSFRWRSLNELGALESVEGYPDRAARRFLLAIELNSRWKTPYKNLNKLLEKEGKLEKTN